MKIRMISIKTDQRILSCIPVPVHVNETEVIQNLTPDFIKTSVRFMMCSNHISVSTITEWSVCWVFTIAKFVVTALWDVECNWSASGYVSVAWTITTWVGLTQTAWAPWINFSLLQISVVREPTWIAKKVPLIKGIDGGLYFPSMYGMFSGMGTFLYLGKSDTSSGEGSLVSAGGLSICGGWMKGSFKWASPSIKTEDILRYLAAFFNIDAINLNILF